MFLSPDDNETSPPIFFHVRRDTFAEERNIHKSPILIHNNHGRLSLVHVLMLLTIYYNNESFLSLEIGLGPMHAVAI